MGSTHNTHHNSSQRDRISICIDTQVITELTLNIYSLKKFGRTIYIFYTSYMDGIDSVSVLCSVFYLFSKIIRSIPTYLKFRGKKRIIFRRF